MASPHRPRTALRLAVATWATATAALLLAACSSARADKPVTTKAAPTTAPQATTTTTGRPVALAGTMTLDPSDGPAGTSVTVHAGGLPSSTALEMLWTTHDCAWVLKGDQREEYHGRRCTPRDVDLGKIATDLSGAATASFVVPDDFGFAHDLLLVDGSGTVRNRAMFDVAIQVSVSPDRGPVGTPIKVTVKGMGVDALENNRQIIYDNGYTGWLSSVTTKGTASAVIPATGGVGPHVIQIARGAFTFPYLNPAQSPRPDIPVFESIFTVTDGAPVLPDAPANQTPGPRPSAPSQPGGGPVLASDVASGPAGTTVTLSGSGFPASSDVAVNWFRVVGNRVAGKGWEERSVPLPAARTAPDGSFRMSFAIPHDVGGPHRIEAATAGMKPATASVTVTPAVFPVTPAAGPEGSHFDVTLTGVGWTETANIYTVVYDNRYIGYVCGFNSQGDVTIPMTASGAPGWHFVDLYPAIYKGEEAGGQQSFRIPQLTYTDHPGERLPAFHLAFFVTG